MTEHVSKVYVGEDLNRLKQLINDGVAVMNEIETLKGGLSDTVKNVAEELDIKAAQLNKALRVYKDNMTYIFGSWEFKFNMTQAVIPRTVPMHSITVVSFTEN